MQAEMDDEQRFIVYQYSLLANEHLTTTLVLECECGFGVHFAGGGAELLGNAKTLIDSGHRI